MTFNLNSAKDNYDGASATDGVVFSPGHQFILRTIDTDGTDRKIAQFAPNTSNLSTSVVPTLFTNLPYGISCLNG